MGRWLFTWSKRIAIAGLVASILVVGAAASYSVANNCAVVRVKILNGGWSRLEHVRLHVRDQVLWTGSIDRYAIVDVGLPYLLSDGLTISGIVADTGEPFSGEWYAIWGSSVYIAVILDGRARTWEWSPDGERITKSMLSFLVHTVRVLLPCGDKWLLGWVRFHAA